MGTQLNRIIKYWNHTLFLFIRFKSIPIWKGTRSNMQLINPIQSWIMHEIFWCFVKKTECNFYLFWATLYFGKTTKVSSIDIFLCINLQDENFPPFHPEGVYSIYYIFIYIQSTLCGWNRKLYIYTIICIYRVYLK